MVAGFAKDLVGGCFDHSEMDGAVSRHLWVMISRVVGENRRQV